MIKSLRLLDGRSTQDRLAHLADLPGLHKPLGTVQRWTANPKTEGRSPAVLIGRGSFVAMLVSVQIPLADSRGFLPDETRRIKNPDWKNPQAGKGFVRAFGGLKPRLRGGLPEWPSEEVVCATYGAPKFIPPLCSKSLEQDGWYLDRCAFRRLLSNGRGVTRIEVGFSIAHGFRMMPWTVLLDVVNQVLSFEVRCSEGRAIVRECKLGASGSYLAKRFLAETTRTSPADGFTPASWWVTDGEPVVFVELEDAMFRPPDRTFRPVSLPWPGYQLYYTRALHRGLHIGVWILKIEPGYSLGSWTYQSSGKIVARQVRLHLMRLHAERQTLKVVFQHIDKGYIPIQARLKQGDPLQTFLNHATGLLLNREIYGVPMSPMLRCIEVFDDLVMPGQRASLLAQLNDIRPNVLKKIRSATQVRPSDRAGIVNIIGNEGSVTLQLNRKDGRLVSQFVNADGATIHGDLVVADFITNSFNRVRDSKINGELRTKLDDLNKAVSDLTEYVSPDAARDAAKALDAVTREAISTKVDEDWFSAGVKKLTKIAETVGESATPVINALAALTKLLNLDT